MKAPSPSNETARLAALHEYQILDTLPEQAYNDLTRLASEICRTPIALVTLIDSDRLVTSDGHVLGTLCVIDSEPRELTDEQMDTLRALARQVMAQLELRRRVSELQILVAEREQAQAHLRAHADKTARFQAILLDLARSPAADLKGALRQITRAVADALEVERVSTWFFNAQPIEAGCAHSAAMNG